eukprot:CAMPEP_0203761476 /NCGR_PEP_ID=MMETSP0098-20131031/14556_1 /ASSEMBLY_ACC=CAM_ASM_000208 /TAXON_ID=96639 /ORGANISM=" , Strain NY0313808BC1" /LENGTH=634 /DNA_ID=CAMNT_0050655491 /DNA_START=265 /DNA_END=2166 /DNA_ORIENTATION=+
MRVHAAVFVLLSSTCILLGAEGRLNHSNGQNEIGFAFCGGGFRAHAVHSAVVASLLGPEAIHSTDNTEAIFSKVFQNVGSFGGVSGGGWFQTHLLHSKQFNEVLREMALSYQGYLRPVVAYNESFIQKFLNSPNVSKSLPDIPETVTGLLRKIMPTMYEEDKTLIDYSFKLMREKKLNWNKFSDLVLSVYDDVDIKKPLFASQATKWSKNKLISFGTSIVAKDDVVMMFQRNQETDASNQEADASNLLKPRHLTYKIKMLEPLAKGEQASFIPYAMRTKIGCPPMNKTYPGMRNNMSITYTIWGLSKFNQRVHDWLGDNGYAVIPVQNLAPQMLKTPYEDTQYVSLADAAACSSDVMAAGNAMFKTMLWIAYGTFLAKVAMGTVYPGLGTMLGWAMDVLGEQALRFFNALLYLPVYYNSFLGMTHIAEELRAKTTITPWTLANLTDSPSLAMGDGGFSDTSGIAQLVAEGVTNIVAVVSPGGHDTTTLNDLEELSGLFKKLPGEKLISLADRYGTHAPIFDMTRDDLFKTVTGSTFKTIQATEASHLKRIRVGQVKLTTIESKLHGVSAGISVTLQLIMCVSDLGMGPASPTFTWDPFPKLAGEVTDYLAVNGAHKTDTSKAALKQVWDFIKYS